MATTYVRGVEVRKGRSRFTTIRDVYRYIANPAKTDEGRWVTSFNLSADPDLAAAETFLQQNEYETVTGRSVDKVPGEKKAYILLSFRQSFLPGECDAETAHRLGCEFAEKFLGGKYQYMVTTHTNTECLHNHIAVNIVNDEFIKFHITPFTYMEVRRESDRICEAHGLSTVIPSQGKASHLYSKSKESSYRTVMRRDIDASIAGSKSYDEFLNSMGRDYEIRNNGKYLRLRHKENGQKRFFRSYSLGPLYSEQNIRFRIGAVRIPQKKFHMDLPSVIKSVFKMRSHQIGPIHAGYAQHKENIQAMLAALSYVKTNQIESFRDLAEKINNTARLSDQVSGEIDSLEEKLSYSQELVTKKEQYLTWKPLWDTYQEALLKNRFYEANRQELDEFDRICSFFKINGIEPAKIETAALKTETDSIHTELEKLKNQYGDIQDELTRISIVKNTILNVYDRKTLLAYHGKKGRDEHANR